MKKLVIVLSVVLIVAISAVYYHSVRKEYKFRLRETIRQNTSGLGPSSLLEAWRSTDSSFPSSLEEMYPVYQEEFADDVEMYYFEQRCFRDPFSPTNAWVLYVPLYSENGDTIQSYLVVSAGIDGKLDNDISEKRLTVSNWKETLHLYNPDEFEWFDPDEPDSMEGSNDQNLFSENLRFNLWDYWFGKKDLLVFRRDKLVREHSRIPF